MPTGSGHLAVGSCRTRRHRAEPGRDHYARSIAEPFAPPVRPLFLLHGEDSFRARLRLAELVRDLLAGGFGAPGDLAVQARTDLGGAIGLARHDAKTDRPADIALSGQAQGLFASAERSVVLVENADVLQKDDQHEALLDALPADSPLVLLVLERMETGRRRSPARGKGAAAAKAPVRTLPEAVEDAGGRIERIERLAPDAVGAWIDARAALHKVTLAPGARSALVELGPDTERLENEMAKLAVWAQGARVEAEDARRLVTGAIEADVFNLTGAVVRRDVRAALAALDVLLADGQPVLQILALLQWQVRVLHFATFLDRTDAQGRKADPAAMAKAIRTTPGAILRWRQDARRLGRGDAERLFEALYATDIAIKSGRVESEEAALMLCVLDLCGVKSAGMQKLVEAIPAPRRR